VDLPIAFDGWGRTEVDLLCADSRVVVEIDGGQYLADPVSYRRDRRKDQLLQENGYLVLRYLAEDLATRVRARWDSAGVERPPKYSGSDPNGRGAAERCIDRVQPALSPRSGGLLPSRLELRTALSSGAP
jgi:hypothetical protein